MNDIREDAARGEGSPVRLCKGTSSLSANLCLIRPASSEEAFSMLSMASLIACRMGPLFASDSSLTYLAAVGEGACPSCSEVCAMAGEASTSRNPAMHENQVKTRIAVSPCC
jgi:hypothetical protein